MGDPDGSPSMPGGFYKRKNPVSQTDVVERIQAEESLARYKRDLSVFRLFGNVIVKSLDLHETLENILSAALEVLQADGVGVYLLEPDGETMVLRIQHGFSEDFVRGVRRMRLSEGASGLAAAAGRPVVVDIPEYPTSRLLHFLVREGIRTVASTPLLVGTTLFGTLNLTWRIPCIFPPEEVDLLADVGRMIGQAVCNARLHEDLQGEITRRIEVDLLNSQRMEALRDAHQRLSFHVNRMPLAYIVWDQDFRVAEWNPAAERIFGWKADEALGRHPCGFIVSGEEQARIHALWSNLSQRDDSDFSITPNIRKDGKRIVCEWFSTSLRDASGSVSCVLSMVHDITEKTQLERQLQMAHRMGAVGTLAGGIAHDFNNVLTVILGYSALMRSRLADQPKPLEDLDQISGAAERAATLTRQLLTFARRQVVEPVNLDLRDVVKDLMKFFVKVAGEQIEVTTFLAEDLPTIRGDRGQVEQVLMNLVLNARDAMPGGGRLLVEAREIVLEEGYIQDHTYMRKGRYGLLSVSDTGSGMDEATRERVFEPFFTTKGPDKGTGLGLSVVYGIVKQHDGYIHLYSEPGKGSTVKIYFPAIEGSPDVLIPAIKEPIRGGSETILLVEDEASILALAKRTLKDIGYAVFTACNGEEAVDTFHRHGGKIPLVVLDVVMPKMGGKEALDAMRKENPGMKAIFMSGYPISAIHETFVILPDTPFLGKPFAPTVLARKVREVLDR